MLFTAAWKGEGRLSKSVSSTDYCFCPTRYKNLGGGRWQATGTHGSLPSFFRRVCSGAGEISGAQALQAGSAGSACPEQPPGARSNLLTQISTKPENENKEMIERPIPSHTYIICEPDFKTVLSTP